MSEFDSIRKNGLIAINLKDGDKLISVSQSNGDENIYVITKLGKAIAFNEKDIKGYNFNYGEIWHTERDTYSKSIPEYQEHAATVMAIVTLGVANLEHLLSREGLYK